MRASRYNVVVEDVSGWEDASEQVQAADETQHAREHLVYNTANAAFALLDDQALQTLRSGDGPAAAQLASLGFLTELTPDEELQAQQRQFDLARADLSKLVLSIVPTYACNYRCPYCYELGHNDTKGKMGARTADAILKFVQQRFDAHAFEAMEVQWYGGDPSLALDVVERLSAQLVEWCAQHGVSYTAMMLSNANLIDDEAAQLLSRSKVGSVLLTIDGPEEVHNVRRVAADGSNSYQRNIAAARALRAQDISVSATMNVDKVTWPLYPQFRDRLLAEEGIALNAGKLCDYGHFYGQAPFAAPDFDLMTHQEFAQAGLELFRSEPHTAAELHEMLRPVRRFCSGQLDNYFIIDLLGNVYDCDGWVGDISYARFNLFDGESAYRLHDVSHDATRDEKCSACELLPLCQGSCHWERACNDWPCHPLKYTMEGYLRVYRSCFPDARLNPGDFLTVLAHPQPLD